METRNNSEEFNPEASLKVIYEMLQSTRAKIGKNYFYYLFWGYLVAATCIAEYVLITVVEYNKHYLVWPAFMVIGLFISLIFYFRDNKARTSRSYVGTTIGLLWSGWFVSLCILILFLNLKGDYLLILPVIMSMYGLAVFVTGGVVSFRPLMFGAVLAWTGSMIAFFEPYTIQLIIMIAVVIFSYVIPGYILKAKANLK